MASMDIYNAASEHAAEDIHLVRMLADKEQQRRMADPEGENHKRIIAHNTSELFTLNTRSTWFQQGSAYAFQLLNVAGKKASQLTSTISTIASEKGRDTANEVKLKLDTLSIKGKAVAKDVAMDVKARAEVAGNKSMEFSSKMTSIAGQKGKETATELKQRAQDVQAKGVEAVKTTLQEGLDKVQGAASLIKESSLGFIQRINLVFSNKTNLTFLLLEEEAERAYRMNSVTQTHAISNALNVSRLIKDLGYEFYRPTFEPTRTYSTRMLENLELSRRSLQDASDRTSVNNAKAVAELIQHKFLSSSTIPAPASVMAKKEVVAELDKQGNRLTAAM